MRWRFTGVVEFRHPNTPELLQLHQNCCSLAVVLHLLNVVMPWGRFGATAVAGTAPAWLCPVCPSPL